MGALDNAGVMLVQIVFGLFVFVILLRFLLQWFGADFRNPVSQLVLKLTDFAVQPLRRILPSPGGVDVATLALAYIVESVKLMLIVALMGGGLPHFGGLFVWATGKLIDETINIFFYAILIQIILSWVNANPYNPVLHIIDRLSSPLLGRARVLIPPVSGFDLSPIPVMIGLQLLTVLLAKPIMSFGSTLAFS